MSNRASYTIAVKDVIAKVRDNDLKLRIAKSAKRALTRPPPGVAEGINFNDLLSYLTTQKSVVGENVITALQEAASVIKDSLTAYFKRRRGKIIYKRPDKITRA